MAAVLKYSSRNDPDPRIQEANEIYARSVQHGDQLLVQEHEQPESHPAPVLSQMSDTIAPISAGQNLTTSMESDVTDRTPYSLISSLTAPYTRDPLSPLAHSLSFLVATRRL